MALIPMTHHPTYEHYSPWDQLPAPIPSESTYLTRHFYENTAKHLISDFVRIMNNGLHIDLNRVEDLEKTLDAQLVTVTERLAKNPLIAQFQALQYEKLLEAYRESQLEKIKPVEHFIKPFKHKDLVHRSYFMYLYANSQGISQPSELLPGTTIPKWDARLVKTLSTTRPLLQRLLDGSLTSHPLITEAMNLLATHKAELHNRRYVDNLTNPNCELPPFNPGSPQQKTALFNFLGIESEATSKDTGLPSWDRDQIERVFHETTDENVRELCQCFIDHSYAAIVRNNFIAAFYRYTVDNRLHGTLRLAGAKSFRPTSQNPNLLNMPSTGSIFAKPIKRCFTAPPGKVICSIDFASLEDKIIANLSNDKNKIITQTDPSIDAHLFHATIYFKAEFEQILGTGLSHRELTVKAKEAMDAGNKRIKELRQMSKSVTFGASYGAFPPKIASSIKCSLQEAEVIFNAYHNDMYPGITNYRENYVLPTAKQNNELHLGLGFKILTDDADKDIRTLSNSSIQFWSILTLLTVNKMHQLIDDNNLQNDILITSTIYDSIFFEVTADASIIKWLNDTIIPIITQDFMPNQIVKNDCDLCVGTSWADYDDNKLPINASIEYIQTILDKF